MGDMADYAIEQGCEEMIQNMEIFERGDPTEMYDAGIIDEYGAVYPDILIMNTLLPSLEGEGHICMKCGKGELIEWFRPATGDFFLQCSRGPDCTGEHCIGHRTLGDDRRAKMLEKIRGMSKEELLASIHKMAKELYLDKPCPKCNEGKGIVRTNGKTGKQFIGCTKFPKCKWTI